MSHTERMLAEADKREPAAAKELEKAFAKMGEIDVYAVALKLQTSRVKGGEQIAGESIDAAIARAAGIFSGAVRKGQELTRKMLKERK